MTGQVIVLVDASDGEYNNLIDDATLRLDICGSGTGEYIIISVAWQNSATDVCIDGSYLIDYNIWCTKWHLDIMY